MYDVTPGNSLNIWFHKSLSWAITSHLKIGPIPEGSSFTHTHIEQMKQKTMKGTEKSSLKCEHSVMPFCRPSVILAIISVNDKSWWGNDLPHQDFLSLRCREVMSSQLQYPCSTHTHTLRPFNESYKWLYVLCCVWEGIKESNPSSDEIKVCQTCDHVDINTLDSPYMLTNAQT